MTLSVKRVVCAKDLIKRVKFTSTRLEVMITMILFYDFKTPLTVLRIQSDFSKTKNVIYEKSLNYKLLKK